MSDCMDATMPSQSAPTTRPCRACGESAGVSRDPFTVNGQYCGECRQAWMALRSDERRAINHRLYVLRPDQRTGAIVLTPFTHSERPM